MAFHDVRFPAALSLGASGGPERRTEVVALASGHEERNSPWALSRRRYDAGTAMRSLDDLHALLAFWEARLGRLHAFRWKDWADHKSCAPSRAPATTDQLLGHGDGATRAFALRKSYGMGPAAHHRPITKPVPGSVVVAVAGAPTTAFALDPLTGTVTLAAAPPAGAPVTAGFEFDVPVRFDADHLRLEAASLGAGEAPAIPVVEVRE